VSFFVWLVVLVEAPALAAGPSPGASFTWTVPAWPVPVAHECPRQIDLQYGQPLPSGLVDPGTSLLTCSGTLVPSSDLAHYLLTDAWAGQAGFRGEQLTLDRAWYQAKVVDLSAPKKVPWSQRPRTQRTIGEIEGAGGVALAVFAAVELLGAVRP